jgi:hypothetical protein
MPDKTGSAAARLHRQSRRPLVSGSTGDVEVGVTVVEVVGSTVTSTMLVVVLGGDVSIEVTVAGDGTGAVTVTGTAGVAEGVGGAVTSAGRGLARPATSSAATSNPATNPASPVTAAEPQVGRPLIRAPPRHA